MYKYIMSFSCWQGKRNRIPEHPNISLILLYIHHFSPSIIHFEAAEKYIQFSVIFLLPFYLFCYILPSRKTCAIIIISFRVNEISMHIFSFFCFYLMNFGVDFYGFSDFSITLMVCSSTGDSIKITISCTKSYWNLSVNWMLCNHQSHNRVLILSVLCVKLFIYKDIFFNILIKYHDNYKAALITKKGEK